MNNNLLLIFEDSIFEIYNEDVLKEYFSFFQRKVDYFIHKLNLNLVCALNDKYKEYALSFFQNSDIIFYDKNIKSLLEEYLKLIDKKGFNLRNYTILLSSSYPFFSIDKNEFVLNDAEKYLVDYYYGENFPEGIVAEVFKNSIINELIKLSTENDFYHQNVLFDILLRNVSVFDIDLIEGFDYYLPYRISLSISNYSSLPIINKIINNTELNIENLIDFSFIKEAKVDIKWEDIQKLLQDKKNLYTIPKTYIIEISSSCNFSCIHCLYPRGLKRETRFINKELLFNFISSNKLYFIDAIFIIGGFGEPFMHPEFFEIINFLSKNNKVYIETNGSFLTEDIFDKFIYPKNINIVVSLDAIKEETYKKLGKKMILSLLLKILFNLLEKYPENMFISYLRIPQNDEELEEFYNYFKNFEKNIIFRKFNSYSKNLPNLEVADLTPVERFPCYHLRRDLFILSDGKISLCYSDYNGEILNINLESPLNQIIDKMKKYYFDHCINNYPELCKNCNEFYTYFF